MNDALLALQTVASYSDDVTPPTVKHESSHIGKQKTRISISFFIFDIQLEVDQQLREKQDCTCVLFW